MKMYEVDYTVNGTLKITEEEYALLETDQELEQFIANKVCGTSLADVDIWDVVEVEEEDDG